MVFRSFFAALFLIVACSHAPAPVVTEAIDDSSLSEDRQPLLDGDEDQAFLDQSLELALFPWNRDRVGQELKAFVDSDSQAGKWEVRDPLYPKPRNLRLKAIRTERLLPLADGTAAVCADFIDDNGDRVDLDFVIERSDSSSTERIVSFEIHKVNDLPRYSYLEKQGAWVRSASLSQP